MFTWTALLPLSHTQAGPPGVGPILIIMLSFVVVAVGLMVWMGQGGTRLARAREAESAGVAPAPGIPGAHGRAPLPGTESGRAAPVGDRSSDKYWKLGLIYVNRSDPALFVEKRFGIGYTVNFGHPGVWVFLAVLVAVFVAINFIVPHHHP